MASWGARARGCNFPQKRLGSKDRLGSIRHSWEAPPGSWGFRWRRVTRGSTSPSAQGGMSPSQFRAGGLTRPLWAHQCAYECPPLSKTRPALPGKGIPPGFSGSPDPGALSEQRSWQHCPTRGTGGQGGPATLCARTWRGTLPALAVPLAPAVSGCFSRKTHASLCSGRPLPSLFSSVLSEQGRLGKPASLKAALANTDLPGFWSPRPTCGRRRGVFPRKRDRDVDSASPRGSGRTQGSLGTLLGSHYPCRKMPFSKRRK